ncbi:MAG: DNA-processing protein DprA [Lachnospiraceae bacterium]|nr:DNA-processing protein DprA [Lachnospiraceae bacterium]
MDKERIYRLQLAVLAEVMPAAVRDLLAGFGTAERICRLGAPEIESLEYLTENDKKELQTALKRGLPVEMADHMKKRGIGMVCIDEAMYPGKVRCLPDAPYALFYRGELPDPDKKHVAVIGARKCSDYGRRTAEYFGRELAGAGVGVISGMARGIDGMAQEACVDAGGKSYGMLGSGVDVIYPLSNKGLYHKLTENGGVISEYPPGREALSFHFPARNRLISAFSDLLIVVEAREKSGTFITVNQALEQGKDVYAVPGRIEDELSRGCNRLIAQGAGVAHCVEEVLLALADSGMMHCDNAEAGNTDAEEAKKSGKCHDMGSVEKNIPAQARIRVNVPVADEASLRQRDEQDGSWMGALRAFIRKCLLCSPHTAQELYGKLGKPDMKIQELLSELMQMEIEGLVLCRGGRYELK